MSPGEQEVVMKAIARPCCVGQLVNHRHANSAIMIGTIAPRHTMSRHGEQDHDDYDDDHVWICDDAMTRQDGLTVKFTRFSLLQALEHLGWDQRTHLFTCSLRTLYKGDKASLHRE